MLGGHFFAWASGFRARLARRETRTARETLARAFGGTGDPWCNLSSSIIIISEGTAVSGFAATLQKLPKVLRIQDFIEVEGDSGITSVSVR